MKNKQQWADIRIGNESYTLMNLDHPTIAQRVIFEIQAGIDVYYDRRWEATEILASWMVAHPESIKDKRVLILGAGVGLETLVLAHHSQHIWINDLAPTALELCAEQLKANGMTNYSLLPGRYETLELPEVDLVVASFLIYNKETFTAMCAFIDKHQGDVILVNELLDPFPKFLKTTPHTVIFNQEGTVGISLKKNDQVLAF